MQIQIKNLKFLTFFFILCSSCLLALDPDWSFPPITLSSTVDDSNSPTVVLAGNRGVSIWVDKTTLEIRGSVLDYVNNMWTATSVLSSVEDNVSFPKLSIDPSGNTVAVWVDVVAGKRVINGARLPFNTTVWISTAAVPLSSQESVLDLALGGDASGNSVLVWTSSTSGTYNVKAAKMAFGSGTWTSATAPLASGASFFFQPDTVVDAAGNAVAVWGSVDLRSIQGATVASGSNTWTSTNDLPSLVFGLKPKVAVGPTGDAIAVYNAFDGTFFLIRAATLTFGSSAWVATDPPPQDVTDQNMFPQVVVDPSNTATAVWNSDGRIQSASILIGNMAWVAPVTGSLSNAGGGASALAIDASGNVFAAWHLLDHGTGNIQVACKETGTNAWTVNPDFLSNVDSFTPQIAASAAETSVVVWHTESLVQASVIVP